MPRFICLPLELELSGPTVSAETEGCAILNLNWFV